MTVKLYSYQRDKLIANKSPYLTQLAEISCTIVGDFDILRPTIRVETSTSTLNCNYVYIVDLGLYFFVTGRKGLTANHVDIELENDVRHSYYNSIKASDVTATRSNFYNKNIPDSMALNSASKRIQYRKLSQALTGDNYICIIGG